MLRRNLVIMTLFAGLAIATTSASAQQCDNCQNNNGYASGGVVGVPAGPPTQAFGRQWAHSYNTQDWERFYHYPYVYYPQNFYGNEYYRSAESMYYRYPQEMRIPVYNKQWHNYYPEGSNWNMYYTHGYKGPPSGGKYHSGSHFTLDVF